MWGASPSVVPCIHAKGCTAHFYADIALLALVGVVTIIVAGVKKTAKRTEEPPPPSPEEREMVA